MYELRTTGFQCVLISELELLYILKLELLLLFAYIVIRTILIVCLYQNQNYSYCVCACVAYRPGIGLCHSSLRFDTADVQRADGSPSFGPVPEKFRHLINNPKIWECEVEVFKFFLLFMWLHISLFNSYYENSQSQHFAMNPACLIRDRRSIRRFTPAPRQ